MFATVNSKKIFVNSSDLSKYTRTIGIRQKNLINTIISLGMSKEIIVITKSLR